MAEISVPISPGELIDKLTILELKSERINDIRKLTNVRLELKLLSETWAVSDYARIDINAEWAELKRINAALWDIEDQIRDEEREQRFGEQFVKLARAVYVTNDDRAAVKRQINTKLGSQIVEEKSYADYKNTR